MATRRLVPLALLVTLVGLAAPAVAATVATYSAGTYEIRGDSSAEVIVLSCDAGSVSPASTPVAPCTEVTAIDVYPDAGDDQVDLSAITRADFPEVHRVVILGDAPFFGSGADVLRGSQLDDSVVADDDDVVFGEGGDDVLIGGLDVDGGPGDDVITGVLSISGAVTGGDGDDRLTDTFNATLNDGGPGNDTLDLDMAMWYGSVPLTATFTAADFTVATAYDSRTYPVTNVEHLDLVLPGSGQTIDGSAFPGDMAVSAAGGNDTLIGTSQADLLDGGSGDDVINARDGIADVVRCGYGDDTATLDAVDQVSGCEHRTYLRNQTSAISGPSTVQRPGTAWFTFSSPTPRSTFQCRIDSRAWSACRSPRSVSTTYLTYGWHKISVRAVNLVGQVDLTPSVRSFRVSSP